MINDFSESDHSLEFMGSFIKVMHVVLAVLACIAGIVLMFTGAILYGILIVVGSIILCLISYNLFMFIYWVAFDIKVIRNAQVKSAQYIKEINNKKE